MKNHDVILLEEPLHPDFHKALGGTVNLEDHLLEFDRDYPAFTLGQYRLLQQFFQAGKEILQVEPYKEGNFLFSNSSGISSESSFAIKLR